MAANGAKNGAFSSQWLDLLEGLPEPAEILSARIRDLLSRALVDPDSLSMAEIQELAASVVFHLTRARAEEERVRALKG